MTKTYGRIIYTSSRIGFYICVSLFCANVLFADQDIKVIKEVKQLPSYFHGDIKLKTLSMNNKEESVDLVRGLPFGYISKNTMLIASSEITFDRCFLVTIDGEKSVFIHKDDTNYEGSIIFSIVNKDRMLTMASEENILQITY